VRRRERRERELEARDREIVLFLTFLFHRNEGRGKLAGRVIEKGIRDAKKYNVPLQVRPKPTSQ